MTACMSKCLFHEFYPCSNYLLDKIEFGKAELYTLHNLSWIKCVFSCPMLVRPTYELPCIIAKMSYCML